MYVFNPQICVSYNQAMQPHILLWFVFNPQICVSYNTRQLVPVAMRLHLQSADMRKL